MKQIRSLIPTCFLFFMQASFCANNPTHPPLFSPLKTTDFAENQVIVYETSESPRHYFQKLNVNFSQTSNNGWQHITVNSGMLATQFGSPFHDIIGFGGAFTDSASILFKSLPPEKQKIILEAYFGPTGLEYSLGRVPIASTDFSCRDKANKPALQNCSTKESQYSYADVPYDFNLNHFQLSEEDLTYKIPFIQGAMETILTNTDGHFKLFASPWSAPNWMKNNYSMVHGNVIETHEVKSAWANYLVRFVQMYRALGIPLWGLTLQNEPIKGGQFQNWQTMYYTPEGQADFIQNFLGPLLPEIHPITLMAHDDQMSSIASDGVSVLNNPKYPLVNDLVQGLGLHWYTNGLTSWHNELTKTHEQLAKLNHQFILGTEACEGYLPLFKGPSLDNWIRGRSFAHDILEDLKHNVAGWTDWNLLLDTQGGPNWSGNYVDASILVDPETQTLMIQPMFYFLGHFSKFIRPGSRLLESTSEGWPIGLAPMEEVSFVVPATPTLPERVVVVVLNRDVLHGRKYYLEDTALPGQYLNMTIPKNSIQTIVYSRSNPL